ncbi:MAG: hypothetical protein IJX17_03380 [Clostridia bacterium]|nr:hypothetical protein [Clostridia bacterium]
MANDNNGNVLEEKVVEKIDKKSTKKVVDKKSTKKVDKKPRKKVEEEIIVNQAQMVVVIYNSGYSDKLFEVAKKLNLNGGTFLKAHGMSKFEAEKFFNVVIEPEKEIALLVVNKEITNKLLSEVYDSIGPNTEVQGIAFAINVDAMTDNLNKQLFPEVKTEEE